MPTTPKLALPYPVATDPADVPADMAELATRLDDIAGVASGLATLDATGKVPAAQLPASGGGGGRVVIPVRLRVPRTSTLAGNAVYGVAALTAWDMAAWDFADAVEGRVYGHARLPSTFAATPNATLTLLLAASIAGAARIQVRTHLVGPGDSLNPAAFATTLGPTTVSPGASYAVLEQGYAVTLTAARTLLVEITRFGADGADTLAASLLLLDAFVEVNT